MAKYRQYSEYKGSGVQWLDDIPRHWDVKKLKFISSVQPSNIDKKSREGEYPVKLCNYTDVYYNEVIDGSLGFMKATATAEQIKKFTLHAGDTIITKDSEDPNDIAVSAYVPESLPGVVCGYHLAMIRPKDPDMGWYIKRVFETGYARSCFSTRANGLTRYGLGTYPLSNVYFPIPPKEEAQNIAAFLDHETAKIDRLIAKQERLIELLKEKRQAVISHAVTKGLNPDAPMKDSGVEWLGEVPVHWDVARVKFVAKLESGHTPSKKVEEYWVNCNIPWVSLNDSKQLAQVDYIFDTTYQINEKGLAGSSARLLPPGSVVFTRDATIGLAAITSREMAVSQHLIAWLPGDRITSSFLLRVFNAMKDELDRFTFGATIKTIGMDDVKSLVTTVPPKEEQETICKYIDEKLEKFDLLINKVARSIDLLKEHRTALISAAVTGKIDVRGWRKPDTKPEETATAVNV